MSTGRTTRGLVVGVALLLAAGCSARRPVAVITPALPDSFARLVAGAAQALEGTPYREGGSEPALGFDCSGFVGYVFGQAGVQVPRTVAALFHAGLAVGPGQHGIGDLVFFATTSARAPTHVGIVLGGDRFVHAPSSSGAVRVERLSSEYWAGRLLGARRVFPAPPGSR